MTDIIIKALAPIFVIMLLGFWAGKSKLVDNSNVSLLNIFLMDFALPGALFLATVQTPWAGIVKQAPLILILTLSMWVAYALIYFISVKVSGKSSQDSAVLALTVGLPNYAALGLPILNGAFGEGTGISLSVAVAISCGAVLMTPFCLMILEAGKAKQRGEQASMATLLPKLIYLSFKKPIVFGPLIGVLGSAVLGALDMKAPNLLLISLRPLGAAALAAALFLTGVILSARKLKINGPVLFGALIKNVAQPFVAWGLVLLFGIDPVVGRAGILLIALSAGFFGVVFGNRFGVQSPDAEGSLLVSTGAFIFTIPLFIMLTAGMVAPL
ncbi:AEC family transporter [Rhodoferax sp.]|uniref:AEC family transporter n=1 Tax=Rhodoferax sp. TaxID=50421 RepID=UPI00284D1E92|nr:AEC family transporter [Rhodoferax sp.]MDR3371514.1 AEC family transporter [Rhodoferax sp.]